MTNRPKSAREAVHVVPGSRAVPGVQRHIALPDCLALGPCSPDPDTHGRDRYGFWTLLEETATVEGAEGVTGWAATKILGTYEFLAALHEFPHDTPVVVWTARTWSDRLVLWWVLDAIQRQKCLLSRFWIAEATSSKPDPSDASDLRWCGQTEEDFARAFSKVRPLSEAYLTSGAALWRRYASDCPVAYDENRRRGSPSFPDLHSVAESWGSLFPRASSSSPDRLLLSTLDQEILGSLVEHTWSRPLDVTMRILDSRPRLFFDYMGEHFFSSRLRSWLSCDEVDPFLLVRNEEGGVNSVTKISYRLTRRGMRLVEQGLKRPSEAPSMHVGGCMVYSDDDTWVRREDSTDWKIELWNPPRRGASRSD